MEFEFCKNENYTLVKVNSEKLDTNNVPDLKSELVVKYRNGVKNIILDLSRCSYCDSSGLRAILVANRLCEDAVGTFIITGLQPDVERLVKMFMLHTIITITRTVKEAEEVIHKKQNFSN